MVSPPTRSPSRLVARSRRAGQWRSKSSATSAAVVMTCSQLSSTMQHLAIADHLGEPARVRAARARTRSRHERRRDHPTGASSTRHAPNASPADAARATSNARRVLPTPPGPTKVTNRCSAASRVQLASSTSRPTSGVSASGIATCLRVRGRVASNDRRRVERTILREDRRLPTRAAHGPGSRPSSSARR